MNPNGEKLLMGRMAAAWQKWLPSFFFTPMLPEVDVDLLSDEGTYSTLPACNGVLRTLGRHRARGLPS